jgi:methylthioribulose-1-phosphate dehydratase
MNSQGQTFTRAAEGLVAAGRYLHQHGWVPATSGNFSARLDDGHVAVTVSGRHKGRLGVDDIMTVDLEGRPVGTDQRPSAETALHTQIYRRFPQTGAVLHTHSPNATVLSRRRPQGLVLEGFELLKAFEGNTTHETQLTVPVFANDQAIPRLAAEVEKALDADASLHGYLIAGHGLYTWGSSLEDALRHVEAFEFLFQCALQEEKS